MYRRTVLGGVSLAICSLAGCTEPQSEAPTPENSSQDDEPTTDPDQPEGEDPDRTYNEALLVELYDLATEFQFQASQQFEDGRSQFEAGEYGQAARRFTAAEEKYDASNTTLVRLTNRLEAEGLAGFDIADTARRHVEAMGAAARNFTQASVAAADGEETTADSYRETAENSLTQAGNYQFAAVSEFRTALETSQ